MPYGVGDTREGRHVGAYLDKFERGVEDEIRIGHLLTAHEALAGKVGCRRDILVYHRISAATAVVLVAHLFTQTVAQPVGSPRLAFGNVVGEGCLEWEEASSVSLGTRLDALFLAP